MRSLSLEPRDFEIGLHEPRHPAEILTGCRVTARGEDWATAAMVLPRFDSAPEIPLGWLGILADSAAAQALGRLFAQGFDVRTVDLRLDAVAAVPPPGAVVTAHGEMISSDHRTGLSSVRLHGPDGTDIAVGTARFLVVPGQPPPGPSVTTVRDSAVRTSVVPDLPSLDEIFGITASVRHEETSTLTAELPAALCNKHGIVHGGLHISLIDHVMRALVGHSGTQRAPGAPELLDLTLTYQRPIVPAVDATVLLRATAERRGRRITTVNAAVQTLSGRVLTSGQGTFLSATEERP
ncbi:hotdog domain-containing protein [Rhodococcus jostii]|uniref:hotdog domain-containing protein n=1 Tax=Rhodococcus jostii TaxID=132919 RepID=UPI003643D1B1